jgi:CheY-specific phosphatase CheX
MNHPSDINIGTVHEWLTQAIQDVSETMFGQAGFPVDQPDDGAFAGQVLVACIGIRGNCQLEVAMYFPQPWAHRLASLSLDMPPEELDEKMTDDVAGEFSNMVVGAVKSRVSDFEIACAMTVPRVVRCTLESPDSDRKILAALAVIRGSAGPRAGATASAHRSVFRVGDGFLRVDLHF